MSHDWKRYAQRRKGFPPREAVSFAINTTSGRENALDIGAGGFNEVRFLADNGFKQIDVLDIEPYSIELAKEYQNVNVIISPVEDHAFPTNHYDLISAMYIIPFVSEDKHEDLFRKMYESLAEKGILVFNLFGKEHGWRKKGINKSMHFYSKEEAKEVEKLFPEVALSERRYWTNKKGNKILWHTFEYIVRKS